MLNIESTIEPCLSKSPNFDLIFRGSRAQPVVVQESDPQKLIFQNRSFGEVPALPLFY
jgi:hypothetical protein